MSKQNSIEHDLEMLARLAARLLATPVVTITVYDSECDADDMTQAITHNAMACDAGWAARNADIDITQLGSPRTAVAQHLGLYAAVPMRNGEGSVIGMVACADDKDRELSGEELDTLKHVSALATSAIRL